MKLGVVADDFTGASDIALTIAEAGMAVTQFIGPPTDAPPPGLGAAVVALKSRTAPVDEAIRDSLAALAWLRDHGAEQIVLKVCSTFDSTAEGNIGPVLEALAEPLGAEQILVCPAFPENGRSVYQGHLFVGDRLLNECGMQNHPLTPMRDADLRRVLGSQTRWPVAHVGAGVVARGGAAISAALPAQQSMVIVDAIQDSDLWAIAGAAKGQALLCGGSGIALGLPANFGALSAPPPWTPITGPGVVLSGSCAVATRAQVERFAATQPTFPIAAQAAVDGTVTAAAIAEWVQAQSTLSQTTVPLVYSSADPDQVRAMQEKLGRERVAAAIEGLFAELAQLLVAHGVKRLVVAGGETSGAVVSALGAQALIIGPRIAAGVPLVQVSGKPVALALKSGNFGDADFFTTALNLMEQPA